MKLLMISGDRALASGKKGAFYNTLEEFHKHWERIDVICPQADDEKLEFTNPFHNVYLHSSPWSIWFQPFWILKKGSQIYKYEKFDIMTVHEYPPFYNGIGAKLLWQKIKVPYVLEIFHVVGHPKAANLKEFIYKIVFKFFIRFDALTAKSVRVMNWQETGYFLTRNGINPNKMINAPAIYVDHDVFRPENTAKEFDIIFVGRLAKNKGIDILLDVIEMNKRLKMIVIGEGPLKDYLELKVQKLGLENNVRLYGWAKDSREVAMLINKSKILVMASYNEGGPRVVIEALACGVPVLATPVGIVPDIVKDGYPKDLVTGWDPDEISKKTAVLLGDAQIYRSVQKIGLNISRNFERRSAISNYAKKLQSLLK